MLLNTYVLFLMFFHCWCFVFVCLLFLLWVLFVVLLLFFVEQYKPIDVVAFRFCLGEGRLSKKSRT